MWQKRLKAILLPVLLFLSLTVLLGLLLNLLIQTDPFQRYLLEQLSRTTGYELSAEKITLNFSNGIGIRARNFRVHTPEGNETAGAARIRMDFSLKDLLKGRIVPTELAILDPEIHLTAKKDRGLSFQGKGPVLEKSYIRILAAFPRVSLENAHVVLETAGLTLKTLALTLKSGQLTRKSRDPLLLEASFHGTALCTLARCVFSPARKVCCKSNNVSSSRSHRSSHS